MSLRRREDETQTHVWGMRLHAAGASLCSEMGVSVVTSACDLSAKESP